MNTRTLAPESIRVIRSRVGEDRFAIEMSEVLVVQGIEDLRYNWDGVGPVGWIDTVHGEIEVYSLGQLLGVSSLVEEPRYQVVILHGNGRRWGLMVDDVSRVLHVTRDKLQALPPSVTRWSGVPFHALLDFTPESTEDEPDPITDVSLLIDVARIDPRETAAEAAKPVTAEFPAFNPRTPRAQKPAVDLGDAEPHAAAGRRRMLALGVSGGDHDAAADAFPAIGVTLGQVLEIFEPRELVAIPRTPTSVRGLTRWRGQLLPVIDLGARLGLPPHRSGGKLRVVVARGADGDAFAFPIRPDIRSITFPSEAIPCEPPPLVDRDLIRGAFSVRDRTILVPDLAAASS